MLKVAQRVAGESAVCVDSWISRVLKRADGLLLLICVIMSNSGHPLGMPGEKMIKTTAKVLFVALVSLAASVAISQNNQGQNNNNQGPVSAP